MAVKIICSVSHIIISEALFYLMVSPMSPLGELEVVSGGFDLMQ